MKQRRIIQGTTVSMNLHAITFYRVHYVTPSHNLFLLTINRHRQSNDSVLEQDNAHGGHFLRPKLHPAQFTDTSFDE